jgi:ferredoxin
VSEKTGSWLLFLLGIVYCVMALLTIRHSSLAHIAIFWALGTLMVFLSYRTPSFLLDSSLLALIMLLFFQVPSIAGDPVIYLPLLSMVLIHLSHRTGSRAAAIVTWLAVMAFYGISAQLPEGKMAFFHYLLLFASLLSLTIHASSAVMARKSELRAIDVLLCSYSGNTAFYAKHFIDGIRSAGAEVTMHRFHYYGEFSPSLDGDALVIAFPVIGWKPPWPLLDYLLRKLPDGNGKPAFIAYTAGGGPENAGVIAGLLLAMKGYRLSGRAWGILPINVPTFRIGPRRLYDFLDTLTPAKQDLQYLRKSGEDFTTGKPAGMPFFAFPFPLFLVGSLLDNRWLNTVLYRNYVWKKRCTKCHACIDYCPSERLYADEKGYPRPRGTCALCMGCINHCPSRAMHMYCWTEYGNPYRARWPEHVVRNRNIPV